MKRISAVIAVFFALFSGSAQVNAPSLRCISCNAAGDLTLTWIIPPDPGGQFFSYEIYKSNSMSGFTLLGTVNTYTINSFTDIGAAGGTMSRYYYLRTRWGAAGTNTSTPSDTLHSIFLNLLNPGNGVATLTYNNLKTPALPSTSPSYTIARQYPVGVWNNITTTSALTYHDTISICTVQYYYQVQLKDNSGCVSTSNISGSVFSDLTRPTVSFMDSVSVNAGGQSVLGWEPSVSPDCVGYVIYKQSGTSWIPIDTVYGINNTSFTYTNTGASGQSVNYCIAAIDSCRNISKLGTDHNTIYLKADYNICSRSAALSWTAYKNLPQGVLTYRIYRSVNAGAFTLLSSTLNDFYTDEGLSPGSSYCYMVRVVNTPAKITSSSNGACFNATAPPASAFAYLKSVSVDFGQTVNVSIYTDTIRPCQGFNVLRSEDGISFASAGFVPYTGISRYLYQDAGLQVKEKNYFYKVDVLDSCGNVRYTSNTGKTILLKVKNDGARIFNNNLEWDNYSTWLGGVAGYYIFRVVNDTPQTAPVNFVPVGVNTYTDNVEDIVSESGKVGYFVQAVENFGNPYGFTGESSSNVADAYVEGKVFVPDAFAPKGRNNIWMPVAQFIEKTDYRVTVFNRWGAKVFETTDDTVGWDGSGMEQGVYAYLVQYKNSRGEYIEMKGTITMLR